MSNCHENDDWLDYLAELRCIDEGNPNNWEPKHPDEHGDHAVNTHPGLALRRSTSPEHAEDHLAELALAK